MRLDGGACLGRQRLAPLVERLGLGDVPILLGLRVRDCVRGDLLGGGGSLFEFSGRSPRLLEGYRECVALLREPLCLARGVPRELTAKRELGLELGEASAAGVRRIDGRLRAPFAAEMIFVILLLLLVLGLGDGRERVGRRARGRVPGRHLIHRAADGQRLRQRGG